MEVVGSEDLQAEEWKCGSGTGLCVRGRGPSQLRGDRSGPAPSSSVASGHPGGQGSRGPGPAAGCRRVGDRGRAASLGGYRGRERGFRGGDRHAMGMRSILAVSSYSTSNTRPLRDGTDRQQVWKCVRGSGPGKRD
jgi:hypothetical protein